MKQSLIVQVSFLNMSQVCYSFLQLINLLKFQNLGAVTAVPETSFNSMHGKIVDLKTEDAQKFSQNHLNEIGMLLKHR